MEIVITSAGDKLTDKFDLRFGRAAYFCVYNTQDKTSKFVSNDIVNVQGGAGTKSAEKMIELGVKRVISGDFGPKAKQLLNKFEIQMVMLDESDSTIESIIAKISK
ncbi:NifB/NifX family molybdenum-iron cluster-binding protein [Carboxylicivirga sp. N1Y90]|uniref:NifB/NifX family molybdenum-iron cluster-binding protein n=1 Tax=Carboxylicivirga fragile TaxID=3417571 RepID=UPI003D327FD6|nr:dinitrogenase iron-molybdenum cofactor biosynthesis protein [Marinilabiliaceae bacterium N1Y90]